MHELLDKIGGPEDLTTDYSNRDSNKGMVNWNFEPYPALNGIQDDYNRKGVLSEEGHKKMAWDVLKNWYEELKSKQ